MISFIEMGHIGYDKFHIVIYYQPNCLQIWLNGSILTSDSLCFIDSILLRFQLPEIYLHWSFSKHVFQNRHRGSRSSRIGRKSTLYKTLIFLYSALLIGRYAYADPSEKCFLIQKCVDTKLSQFAITCENMQWVYEESMEVYFRWEL